MFSRKSVNMCKLRNLRVKLPVMLLKKSVCKTSRFICCLFILNAIVQGTSFGGDNSNLTVSVLKRTNSTTDESDLMAPENKRVKMQQEQGWQIKLEGTVEKEEKIDLSKLDLEELPAFLKRAEKLKELNISRNKLATVPLELLSENKELENLDISRNGGVALLDEGSALKSLKCLRAEICRWKVIPGSVAQFSQLEELYLGGNLLESFNSDFFLNLPSLKVLDLSGNGHITFGSQPWTSLKSLRHLLLRETGLDEIPDSIGTLENLTSLNVSDNKIKRLDPEMFLKLGSLKELDIENNRDLVFNEPTWESLKSLRYLNVEGIEGKEILSGLKKLTKLQKLKLGDNNISVLNPADFACFPDLECLEFNTYGYRPDVVTTGWGHLKSLKKLVINGSTLEVLDDWIEELQFLEELNLSWGRIHTINNIFFVALSKLPNFRVLNLEFNAIHTLPHSILLLKGKNVKIIVRNNSIEHEPSETNVGLERLEKEFGENIEF